MAAEIITKEDLERFRLRLLEDLRALVFNSQASASVSLHGYKARQVREILNCSNGKLQRLRISGKLRCKKIGGTIYYREQDIKKLLEEGY